MSTFSFSCTVNQKTYTGTVTFEGEDKEAISKIKDLDSLLKRTILAYVDAIPKAKTSGISIKFTTKGHQQAQIELVKNLWKQFEVPEASTNLGQVKNINVRPLRVFSLIVLTSKLFSLAKKIFLIFQNIFGINDPKSFGISMTRDTYERAMKILSLINNETLKSPEELSNEDRELLQELLRKTFNNRSFARYLHGKTTTTVEDHLEDFAFISQKGTALVENIDAVSRCLDTLGVKNLVHHWADVTNSWKILDELKKKDQPTEIKELLDVLIPPGATMSVQIFTSQYQRALRELEKILEQHKGFKEEVEACKKLRTGYTAIQKQMKQFQKVVDKHGYEGPLALNQIRTAEVLDFIHFFVERLKKMQIIPKDGPIFELSERIPVANTIVQNLNQMIQMFPGNIPGDVQLTDEVMLKAYTGSHAPIWSKTSGIRFWPQLVKEFFRKGIFNIQPYFAGAMTHGAIFGEKKSVLSTTEILQGSYEQSPAEFTESLQKISYRPDFSKLWTAEGLKALKKLYGPKLNEKELVEKLQELFARNFSKYIAEHEKELAEIKFDNTMAILGVVLRKAPNILQKKMASLFRFIFGRKRFAESKVTQVPKSNLRVKMMCSEFVAIVFDDIQEILEVSLKQAFREKVREEPPKRFLDPLIPSDNPKDFLYPTRLEEAIKDTSTLLPPPLAVRLLVKGMNKEAKE